MLGEFLAAKRPIGWLMNGADVNPHAHLLFSFDLTFAPSGLTLFSFITTSVFFLPDDDEVLYRSHPTRHGLGICS